MPNRYNGKDHDNIRNTDDEDTMLLPDGLNDLNEYRQPHSELPPLRKVNHNPPHPQQKNGERVYTQNAPQFPQSGQPPQFPHSSAPPPPPHQQQSAQYYDYNQQPPQNYSGYSDGGYAPPPAPATPSPPQPKAQQAPVQKKQHHVSEPAPSPKKKKHRHRSLVGRIIGRIIKSLLAIFLVLFGVYSCTSLSLINKMKKEETGTRVHYADSVGKSHVRSVLIIGTDGRTADDRGRSDSMILVSLNSKTNEIIMTSFMRDSYVEIPDNGWNKLNAAYAFGGPKLLMETIEYNFDVRIDDYVTIDFASFVSVVDAVGGVDINVSDEEAEEINVILISEVNELMGDDRMADLLDGGGKLHLNGKQALAYSRIRNVGQYDFERTQRQRRVMSLIIAKLKSFRPSIFKNLASDVIPDISTNMSTLNAYLLSLRLPFVISYSMKQIQIPADGTFENISTEAGDSLSVDFNTNIDIINKEVFAK
ncbi:LCP family protein [Ruminococcus flavefaciens]|uniref:LCP family protein n=1 Tax=Ruminococcus flavefaciens TaxID=1265 RepID=UPI0026F009E7|nr:LCP family protein [Ruminococcus flavefaciens]MDD7516973.1 LCP family protein [Ruminococcus flavefaciens]MDY5691094.1 LCP family protein [Ruminococcus flavefaciens]